MVGETVSVAVDGAVATITLDAQVRRNALTVRMKESLLAALRQAGGDETVRAVVLTGSGRAFCAGQDLAEHAATLRADPGTALSTVAEHYNPIVSELVGMPKPVLAAVNGTCVGAGLGLALACDLRIAASSAKFATAFTGIGLSCDSGLSATLARAVGAARASELVLLGQAFSAAQALEWGVVGRVVDDESFAEEVGKLASALAAGPTLAYVEAKRALAASFSPTLGEVLAAESAAQVRLGQTADHQGAVESFLAKRPVVFDGK
jgi:2-(1,2-epoxy-1,2-dihydrophenyl)acetyl-CoA isomerase